MSYRDLKREVKALRSQMHELKQACEVREDRLIQVLDMLRPYFDAMPEEEQQEFMNRLEGES